ALQNALLRLEPRKNGQGIVDIVLGQFQNDAIAEMQVPAASGDADIGTYPVLQLGPAGKLVFERGSNGFGIATDEERQACKLAVAQRSDDAAAALDQRKLRSVLPDSKRLTLLERDLDGPRIDLAHFGIFHPGKLRELAAGRLDVERDQRGRTVEAEKLQDVDLRRLLIAGNPDVLDGKARRSRDRLRDRVRMATNGHAVKADAAEEGEG